jgi:hypothetical protein
MIHVNERILSTQKHYTLGFASCAIFSWIKFTYTIIAIIVLFFIESPLSQC